MRKCLLSALEDVEMGVVFEVDEIEVEELGVEAVKTNLKQTPPNLTLEGQDTHQIHHGTVVRPIGNLLKKLGSVSHQ